MTTKTEIINLLKTNDRAVARALIVLTERQTATEQATEHTINRNGQGFRPCHARMGTSMAKFYQRNGYLSPKQIAYWRAVDRSGKSRIEIYAGQLLEVSQNRAVGRAVAAAVTEPLPVQSKSVKPADDVGNMMEERLVLVERLDYLKCEYGMSQDSDDPAILEPLGAEIAAVETRLATIDVAIAAAYGA